HEDVFRDIVRYLLEEVEGVYSYEPKNVLGSLLGEKSVKPAITIKWPAADEENQEQVSFEIRLAALYGASIPQMVSHIRQEAADKVKGYTGYDVSAVDVFITKLVRFDKERSTEDDEPKPEDYNQDE
ncbi:MAG: Asp23/Gls24 family envelope stress response protein, partial [Peptococcaceae bacterium]|nr:Asp23/Gls24 family envelope stress response protein [Peptococcaceae bacterium]